MYLTKKYIEMKKITFRYNTKDNLLQQKNKPNDKTNKGIRKNLFLEFVSSLKN